MTTKTLSLIGLALLLLLNSRYTAPQQEVESQNGKTSGEKALPNVPLSEKQAFAVIGFYKNMIPQTSTVNKTLTIKKEQPLVLPQSAFVFNAPMITQQYTQPTKFVYNPKTEKFESRVISLTDAALKP